MTELPLSTLSKYQGWLMTTFVCILIAFAAGFTFRRLRDASYQNRGEALLARKIRANFRPPDYHLLNHVTLPIKDGTTQVDHILVSRYGIFVIETKDFNGWIFANPKHANWTQVIFGSKYHFQNPIFQNFGHVRAVQGMLEFLSPDVVKSAVVFVGQAEFKTERPDGVFDLAGFIEYLAKNTEPVMSQNRMQFCVGRIETARMAISGQTDVEHVESLNRRYGDSGWNV